MKMKKFLNDPNTLTAEMLEGLALAHGNIVDVLPGNLVVSKALKDADRVTIVTLGGTGHEPALSGFVGDGMLDIAVAGDVFAAPNPQSCFEAIKLADKGKGVLFLVLNHAGDMLTGNMTMKMCKQAGLNVRKVVTQEDISNAPRSNADDRRGLAGAVPLYHIAAAAAKEGRSLDEVADLSQRYADSMATIAVAVRCATHPASGASFGDLGDEDMEIGMGQPSPERGQGLRHGERFRGHHPYGTVDPLQGLCALSREPRHRGSGQHGGRNPHSPGTGGLPAQHRQVERRVPALLEHPRPDHRLQQMTTDRQMTAEGS